MVHFECKSGRHGRYDALPKYRLGRKSTKPVVAARDQEIVLVQKMMPTLSGADGISSIVFAASPLTHSKSCRGSKNPRHGSLKPRRGFHLGDSQSASAAAICAVCDQRKLPAATSDLGAS